jgi:hypothetical protein
METKESKYESDCCEAPPKGGLSYEPSLLGGNDGPRKGKCSKCDKTITFHLK